MSERWQRLAQALDELLELDAPARHDRLCRWREAEPEFAADLERLLAADAHSGVLDDGLAAAAPGWLAQLDADAEGPDQTGRRIGPYRLLERLGSGGMGEVWRAARADGGFEQEVAVKLIRPLLDSPALRERFARERRILARLDHPHIARLLDGGVAEDGTPWYAMEYVRGEDLLRHAARAALSPRDRVALLLQVCEAVAHAQAQLVVHRDIKPSNLLVDGEGRVRVLDFGIARLLDESADLRLTGTGVRVYSPAYAAPEQIRGEAVSTATDVYALGAVLFELLSGRLPHPQRSAAPERLLAGLAQETAPRLTQASGERRSFGQDLETLVATALQPDPARRYTGAAQLADDLRRWLAGRPIAAQPDTAGYRLRKFVARHRVGVASAMAVALALCIGLGAALWQARLAREHAARADAEARHASAEAARAEHEAAAVKAEVARVKKVKEFMVSIFQGADPMQRRTDAPLSIDAAFDAALRRARSDLADDPVLQADVFDDFGEIRTNQGRFDEAETLFHDALAVAEKHYGPSHPVVAETLVNLAALASFRDHTAQSVPYIERAVAILERDDGGDPLALANALNGLAAVRQQQGRMEETRALLHRALDLDRRYRSKDDLDLTVFLTNVAILDTNAGLLAQAEAELREAIAIVEHHQGPEAERLLPSLSQLGDLLYMTSRPQEEMAVFRRAAAIAVKSYAGDHPWKALALTDLGWAQARNGEVAAGEATLGEAIAMFHRLRSPREVSALRYLGVSQYRRDAVAPALATMNLAWDACARYAYLQDQLCVVVRANRARLLAMSGQAALALSEAEAAHADLLRIDPKGIVSERAQALQARAMALAHLQRKPEALAQQDAAIALLRQGLGETHSETRGAIALRAQLEAL